MKSESGRSRRLLIALFICLMAVCVGLACVFTACKSDDARDETEGGEAATVTGLSLSKESLTVYAGSSSDFIVTVTMSDNTTSTDYTAISDNESVATVSQSGSTVTVTGVAAGETFVTVTAGEFTASCAVTVSADSVATVELSKNTVSVAEEGTDTITVTVKMTSGSTSTDFTAGSADKSVATVEVSGSTITVTGVAVGKTKITVTAGGITKECEVEVTTPVISKIALSKSNVTLGTNETASVDVIVTLDNGKTTDDYTATVSCEPENIVTASVTDGILTITAGGTEGSAKITVTISGTTISAECSVTVADVQKEYSIDFSDPDTYAWIGTPTSTGEDENGESFLFLENLSSTYTNGILTYVASGASVNKENAGALFTNTASGTYFELDLSAFEGLYVSVSVKMSTNSDTAARSLYINADKSTSSGIKSVESSNKTDYQTLEYGEVISSGETLYLTWSGNIRIFTIDIEIMDPDDVTSEVRDVTLDKTSLSLYVEETDYLTATVEMTIGDFEGTYEWSSSDESIARVEGSGNGATVIAVSEGTVTITVKVGGKEATCTVTVREEGKEGTLESFIVSKTADGSTADSTTYSAGAKVVSNSLFELTTVGSMKYSIGGNNSSISSVNLTDIGGETHTFDQALESGITLTPVLTDTSEVTPASDDDILEVKAIADATVYLYLTLTNDSYSVNPSGTIYYTINDGEEVSVAVSSRTTITTLTLELKVGDVVKVGAEHSTLNSSGAVQNLHIWLFGAEAISEGAVLGGSDEGYAGVTYVPIDGYEWVPNPADLEAALGFAGGSGSNYKVGNAGLTVGSYTFGSGLYFEDTNNGISGKYDFNTQGKDVTIVMTGVYNDLSFYAKTANSGKNFELSLYDASTNELVYTWTSEEVNADLYTDAGILLGPGTYILKGGSQNARISDLSIEEYIEESDPTGITAAANTVDFLSGRTIDAKDLGLIVTVTYENGNKKDITSGYTTDLDNTNLQVGANEIKVTYTYTGEDSQAQDFETTVTIYLYELKSIEISDFSMAYTGGTYYTNNVQKVYLVGDSVSYDYAAVTAIATYTDSEGAEHSAEFILTSEEVTFALYNATDTSTVSALDTAGPYTVRVTAYMNLVSGNSVSDTYTIHVVDATGADITTVNVVHPTEDTDGTETETATYEADSTTGIISVSTITDAIQLIKLMGATDAERKFIYVGEGQYWEKIYIDIPNLSLIGANSYDTNDLATRQEKTEIVYDAMNGVMDPSGTTTYSTVGSATVTVAKEAVGFYAANITFRNYWNTNDLYNEALTITSSTQADAAYINADQSYFYNVTFTGYHDTLEAENGRQVYDHCYIEGRTDFIFGATATCYFNGCTIHSIGAGTEQSNGGYVVAYKGTGNAGTVDYGYIFDGCNFEGDENVKAHSVALGRAWDQYLMMVVMNCTLDGSYAMGGYDGSSNSVRYCKMNAEPNLSRIYEYGNKNAEGGGSVIDATTEGYSVDSTTGLVTDSNGNSVCTIPSAEQAAKFADASVIFAATNGTVSYGSAWDGKCDVITITVMNGDETVATVYGTGSMSVSDLKEAVNARLTDAEVGDICDENNEVIENAISETSTVYISTQEPDPAIKENLYYEYSDFAALTAEEDGTYSLGGITIDLGDSGTFASNNGDGKWFVLTGTTTFTLQVKAGTSIDWWDYQSGLLALTANGETVTLTQYTTSSECLYRYRASVDSELVFSIATDKNQAYIKYIAVNVAYTEDTTINLLDYTGTIQKDYGYYKGIFIDAVYVETDNSSNAKFGNNNGSWLQFNKGTILIFNVGEGATVTASFYNANTEETTYTSIDVTGGVCTITALASTYIASITVSYAS